MNVPSGFSDDARHAGDREPLVIGRIDHDRIAIARLRIFHALAVHVLPDRLIAVGIAAALDVVVAAENAALERAELFQFLGAGIDLLARQIAAAAGAAELQHRRDRAAFGALRAISRAFRENSRTMPGRHLAVAVEIHRAFDLEAELIEIVPVARRGKIALELADIELEIAERAGRAVEQVPIVKSAAAMLQAAFPFHFIALDDLHRRAPLEFAVASHARNSNPSSARLSGSLAPTAAPTPPTAARLYVARHMFAMHRHSVTLRWPRRQ